MKHKTGDIAPAINLPDQEGKVFDLSDFKGSRVLIYFYPKDDTPGCTKQACSIRDGQAKLKQAGIVVLGISTDPLASHWKFAQKYNSNDAVIDIV